MLFKKKRFFLDSFLKILQNLESQILENFQLETKNLDNFEK